MRLASVLAPAVLAALFAPIAPTVAFVTSETHNNNSITASTLAATGTNQVYHWELDSFPKSIAQLQGPLHLEAPLVPGKNPFDIVPDPISKKSRVLRSLYPKNSYSQSKDKHAAFISTPLPKEAFSGPTSRFIRLEYQMMFKSGFDWVKGGKLPGIMLGTEKGCNAGCSGGGTAANCFSTRMMWRAQGGGELYLYAAKSVYFPQEPPETCKRSLDKRSPEAMFQLEQKRINAVRIPDEAEEDEISSSSSSGLEKRDDGSCLRGMGVQISPGARNICNPVYGISIGRGGAFKFRSGTWHNITQIVRLNSKGNAVKDGHLAVYLDRVPVIEAKDLVLLKNGYDPSKSASDHLVQFMFSSFFGGHDSSYKTPVKTWIAWKGFKMSTSVTNIWN